MEELLTKYAFTYGPLMIFFFAVGMAAYKWLPPMFETLTAVFREMVAALNSSTMALNNSTTALNSQNKAMEAHHELFGSMKEMWEEMRQRIDTFDCPHNVAPQARSVAPKPRVRLVSKNG